MKLCFHNLTIAVFIYIILVSIATTPLSSAQFPWSENEGKFPWVDYLASLTSERGIRLVILTRHEASIQQLTRTMFLQSEVAKKLGITELQFLYVSAELWPDYIRRAAERGVSIDVAWGGGPTLFNNLDELGYLMPINPTIRPEHEAIAHELGKIPEKIAGADTYKTDKDGNIRWIGASVSSFGFTVRRDLVQLYGISFPNTWDDLARPEYAKYLPGTPLIGIADPTLSTSNLRIFEIILQAKGWEEGWKILTLLAANSRIYPGSGDARDAVIRGDVAVATTIDFYGYMAMYVNPNCTYIAPEGATIINADPIAIVNITKYPVHAAAFVAWVLNEFGGQQIWLDKDINRIPINPRTFDTPEGQERPDLKKSFEDLSSLSGILFNETLSSQWVNAVMYYFKATLVNAHSDLQAVWAKIADAYNNGKITKEQLETLIGELSKPLRFTDPVSGNEVAFTLEYAMYIGPQMTRAEVYQALMTAWTNGARDKYTSVLNMLESMLQEEQSPGTSPTLQEKPSPGISPTMIALVGLLVMAIIVFIYIAMRK